MKLDHSEKFKFEISLLKQKIDDLRKMVEASMKENKALLERIPIHEERIASLKMAIIGVYTVLGTVGGGVVVYALTK